MAHWSAEFSVHFLLFLAAFFFTWCKCFLSLTQKFHNLRNKFVMDFICCRGGPPGAPPGQTFSVYHTTGILLWAVHGWANLILTTALWSGYSYYPLSWSVFLQKPTWRQGLGSRLLFGRWYWKRGVGVKWGNSLLISYLLLQTTGT